MNDKSLHCAEPWQKLAFTLPGLIPFCFRSPDGVAGKLSNVSSWSELWNSLPFQSFRQRIKALPPSQSACRVCPHVDTGAVPIFFRDPSGFSSDTPYGHNIRLQYEEFLSGQSTLESKPTMLHLEPSAMCNLNCIMCSQHNLKQHAYEPQILGQVIQHLVPYLTLINWSGGEPLAQKSFDVFADTYTRDINPFCSLAIQTNGLLFREKHFRLLQQSRSSIVSISIDGVGDTYENIRRGGSWKQLELIIDKLLKIRETDSHVYILAAFTIQKANIKGIPAFLKWCISKGLSAQFMSVFNYPVNMRPDVFQCEKYESLNWLDALQEGVALSAQLDELTACYRHPLSGSVSKSYDFMVHYKNKIFDGIDSAKGRPLRIISFIGDSLPHAFAVFSRGESVVAYGQVLKGKLEVCLPYGPYSLTLFSSHYEESVLAKFDCFISDDSTIEISFSQGTCGTGT